MRFELSGAAKYSYYLLIFLFHVFSTISLVVHADR